MGRPKVREGEVKTRTRLLEAAEREFAGHGYSGAKLADIAKQAGISRPSLLYHYTSKDVLYAAVVRRVLSDIGSALADAMATDGPFGRRLDAVIGAFATFAEDRPHAARVILRETMDDLGPGHALILEAGVPLLDAVEDFMRRSGGEEISCPVPIRQALLTLVSATFVRRASGELDQILWQGGEHSVALARAIFLGRRT